jgi:serine/threonine protein kinase
MAEVYLAKRVCAEGVECMVAIKRLRAELAHQDRCVQMFIREAQILGRLMHPNIVSVLDLERDADGQLFLVMEYVEGVDLGKLLDSGPLPHSVVIFIAAGILSGLGHAHRSSSDQGRLDVVHRDLSPHNVLLSWEGGVKVAEQPLDDRSDLFAVGIMLWEMLTGERCAASQHDALVRPSLIRPVAPDLEAVVMRLLARDPSRSYPSAEAARQALTACRGASAHGRCELERVLTRRFPGRRRPPSLEGATP